MFCPKCRAEYKEGILECPECKVALVEDLPEDKLEYEELITVYGTADPAMISLAKSLLENANMKYALKSQGLQSIYALGYVEFQVEPDDVEAARELLSELKETGDEETE